MASTIAASPMEWPMSGMPAGLPSMTGAHDAASPPATAENDMLTIARAAEHNLAPTIKVP